ncbi:MAG: ATP-binding protein [Synergistaceae bacterium]|nr:ATP-binding protein [Synergistaceae bacterium]
MENNEIVEHLRQNNPFSSSASPLPWENNNPDLLQLSREASEDIEHLMRQKRREPSKPLAGLVLGEAGAGKTHMLTRILRRLRNNSRPAVFVAVKTFRDPDSVTRHLLSEIFISLKRTHSEGRTQFDMIMSEFMDSYQERRREDGFSNAEIKKIDPRVYIARDIPQLERNFLKCFVKCLSGDSLERNDILDWLSDGLDEEDALKLGLPSRDLSSMTDARRELEAEKVLSALGQVLAYAKVPMIVCFDQLDSMRDRALISAWGNIINLLMNDLVGILPLCFVRSQIWNDVFMPVLDEAVVHRLSNNTMIMKSCSIAQARQLIRARIESVFGEDAEEIFQWLIAKMGSKLHDGYSPRMVIEMANHAITATGEITEAPNPNDIDSAIKAAYEEEYRKVQSEPGTWPPNAGQLALALEVWLNAHDGFEFQDSGVKNMKLIGTYRDKHVAFAIVTGKSHFVASAGLKRAAEFIEKHKNNFCCYITETKVHKSTWKIANEELKAFEKLGGHSLFLDDDTRITWYALTALINRIDNGDVNLYLSSGNRTATREDVRGFVKTLSLMDFPFDDDGTPLRLSPVSPLARGDRGVPDSTLPDEIDEAILCNVLSEFVDISPMKMLGFDKGVQLLAKRGINMTIDELVAYVLREDTFKIYECSNGESIITFTKR